MFGNVLVLGSFPDPDLSCCYQIMQLEVWKSTKPPQNYAMSNEANEATVS